MKTRGVREAIVVEGGPLDGLEADIRPECSELGFFVHREMRDETEWWLGYYASGRRDALGRRIFAPGRPGVVRTDEDG